MTDKLSIIAEESLGRLIEHCDSVLILCTKNEDGVTRAVARRRGNYYATKGMVTEWLEEERNKELALHLKDRPDDD